MLLYLISYNCVMDMPHNLIKYVLSVRNEVFLTLFLIKKKKMK